MLFHIFNVGCKTSSNITQESENFKRDRLQQNMFGLSNVPQPLFSKSNLSWPTEEGKTTQIHTVLSSNSSGEFPPHIPSEQDSDWVLAVFLTLR